MVTETVATWGGVRAFVRRVLDDVLEVVACELEELFEDCGGLVLVQRSHFLGYIRNGF